jgi:hypothetical protein
MSNGFREMQRTFLLRIFTHRRFFTRREAVIRFAAYSGVFDVFKTGGQRPAALIRSRSPAIQH